MHGSPPAQLLGPWKKFQKFCWWGYKFVISISIFDGFFFVWGGGQIHVHKYACCNGGIKKTESRKRNAGILLVHVLVFSML